MSVVEAISYLALLVAAVVKRSGASELGVTVIGPIHGVLFLVFATMVLVQFKDLGWPLWKAISAIFIGSLPFGGFYIDRTWLSPLQPSR